MATETSKQENINSKIYTFEDAMKVADDIFHLLKDKDYHPGAFVHGLVFALETAQQSYNISQKQLAEVKRGTRKYLQEVQHAVKENKTEV